MQLIIQFAAAALQGMAFVFMGESLVFFLPLLASSLTLITLACSRNSGLYSLSMPANSGISDRPAEAM